MKGYATFPKTPAFLEPHHQMIVSTRRSLRGLTLLQRCSRCILLFQPIGLPGHSLRVLPRSRETVGVFYSPCQLCNTFSGLFNTEVILVEEQKRSDEEVHTFPEEFYLLVKIVARMVFELAYYGVKVQHVSNNAMGSLPFIIEEQQIRKVSA